MNGNEVFMHIEELGNLYFSEVLLHFVYPQCFVCRDTTGSRYLFYEMHSSPDKDTWLVSRITDDDYGDILHGRKPVQEAYHNRTAPDIFSVTKIYGDTDTISLDYDGERWLEKLPEENIYPDCG